MNQNKITILLNCVEKLINLITYDNEKRYTIKISRYDNKINIYILEQYSSLNLFDITIEGTESTYQQITNSLISLVINNEDVFGALETSGVFQTRQINGERIITKNITIYIPIYNENQLLQMQAHNEIMLKKFENNKIYKKNYQSLIN